MHFFATLAKILSLPFGNDYNSTIFTEPRSEMLSLPETLYPSEPTNVRSYFSQTACHVHGHPSSGGILIKHFANLVDLQFLSLPRNMSTYRSENADEEDAFCDLMRRIGATWWESEEVFIRALVGEDAYNGDPADDEKDPLVRAANKARAQRIVTFGWPTDGFGVWVLRFKRPVKRPTDYGKMEFATSMGERIELMKQFGAKFVEDLSQVKELQEPWSRQPPEVSQCYVTDDSEVDSESSLSDCEDD
jgi:hypothetical protein